MEQVAFVIQQEGDGVKRIIPTLGTNAIYPSATFASASSLKKNITLTQ